MMMKTNDINEEVANQLRLGEVIHTFDSKEAIDCVHQLLPYLTKGEHVSICKASVGYMVEIIGESVCLEAHGE